MLASRLLALLCASLAIAVYQPRIIPAANLLPFHLRSFAGSADLWRHINGSIAVSTDVGASWNAVESLGHDIESFTIDENFPESRAFAVDGKRGLLFQTVDQGRSWTQMPSDHSFWDIAENEADPNTTLVLSVATNPFVRDDIVVNPKHERFNIIRYALKSAFLSTDGKALRLMTGLKLPKGQLLFKHCDIFGAAPAQKVICSFQMQVSSWTGYHQNYFLFHSDNHGKTFKVPRDFKLRTVLNRWLLSGYDVVLTDAKKKVRGVPMYRLFLSRDAVKYEKAEVLSDYRPPTLEPLGGSPKRLLVRTPRIVDDELREELLVSNAHGPLLTSLVILDPYSQSVTFIDTDADRVATILHPWHLQSMTAFPANKGDALITFDDGHEWSRLKLRDPKGEFGCDPALTDSCFVNTMSPQILEMHREEFGRSGFYSNGTSGPPYWEYLSHLTDCPRQSGVLGVSALIGTAVTINGTLRSTSESMTFLTTDGGRSWQKILDFPAKVAFGNHGKLLVAIPFSNGPKISQFRYSMDQGSTWSTGEFDRPFRAFMLTLVPGDASSTAFLVSAWDSSSRNHIIDFSEMLAGPNAASDRGSDAARGPVVDEQQVLRLLSG